MDLTSASHATPPKMPWLTALGSPPKQRRRTYVDAELELPLVEQVDGDEEVVAAALERLVRRALAAAPRGCGRHRIQHRGDWLWIPR